MVLDGFGLTIICKFYVDLGVDSVLDFAHLLRCEQPSNFLGLLELDVGMPLHEVSG